jgi:hypothetical protein
MVKYWLIILACAVVYCSKETNPIVAKEYDLKLVGKYAQLANVNGFVYYDSLIFMNNIYNPAGITFISKTWNFRTDGYKAGFTLFIGNGNWNTKDDYINFTYSFECTLNDSGNIIEAFTSQDNVKRQYLFNSASELWIWDGANKQIWTRIN